MVNFENNISLQPFNTFGVNVKARWFCRITSVEETRELIKSRLYQTENHLIIGEASNILFTKDYRELVIKMEINGIDVVEETENEISIRVGAGESWHNFVLHCVDHNYGGIENLSLIPGTCGAAPIQNIGAYGVEIENKIKNVEAIDSSTGELRTFQKEECMFGYRESVFKHALREKYFISSITLTLTKKNHSFNISYGAIKETLKHLGSSEENELTVKKISDAVIAIRQQKMPAVGVLGSAGSFFKNPTISQNHFDLIKNNYPTIPHYPTVNQNVKIPAGWLIEQCGWKGKRRGNIGVHQHQALVIVNYGGGTGEEIFQLAVEVRDSVKQKFNVDLETEVNII